MRYTTHGYHDDMQCLFVFRKLCECFPFVFEVLRIAAVDDKGVFCVFDLADVGKTVSSL